MAEKSGAITTTAEAIRMTNVVTRKEEVDVRTVLLLSNNSEKHETSIEDSTATDCDRKSCYRNSKVENTFMERDDKPYSSPGNGLSFPACYLPLFHEIDGFQLLVDSG